MGLKGTASVIQNVTKMIAQIVVRIARQDASALIICVCAKRNVKPKWIVLVKDTVTLKAKNAKYRPVFCQKTA